MIRYKGSNTLPFIPHRHSTPDYGREFFVESCPICIAAHKVKVLTQSPSGLTRPGLPDHPHARHIQTHVTSGLTSHPIQGTAEQRSYPTSRIGDKSHEPEPLVIRTQVTSKLTSHPNSRHIRTHVTSGHIGARAILEFVWIQVTRARAKRGRFKPSIT